MKLRNIQIHNFRLLADVQLQLEDATTVIVGRNNSGKTSLTELFHRFLGDSTPSFRLEDFSLSAHEGFWNAFQTKQKKETDEEIRKLLPTIDVRLSIPYGKTAANLSRRLRHGAGSGGLP